MEYNVKYKLIGFPRKQKCSANIMLLSTGKVFDVSLQELVRSDVIDDLNKNETREIYRKLYSTECVTTAYDLSDRNQKSWMAYCFLCVSLCVIYVLCTVSGIKPVSIPHTGFIIPSAIFLYPLSFLLIDIVNEFYGMKLARKAIWAALFSNVFFCLFLWVSSEMPSLAGWGDNASFNAVVHSMISVLLASSVSYFVSEYVNSFILCKIKEITNSRHLYFRVISSTVVASALDSMIFIYIAFHRVLSASIMHVMMMDQFIIKVLYAVVGVVPIYWTRWMFNNYINK